MLDLADLPRFARMGIIANCTPLWGTDYNGQYRDIYTRMLGADRVEERCSPLRRPGSLRDGDLR